MHFFFKFLGFKLVRMCGVAKSRGWRRVFDLPTRALRPTYNTLS